MQQLTIAIVPTLAAPPEGAQLVIFCDPRGYVAEIDSSMMLAAAARYAIRHKVYLVPERFIAANYLCLCLLSPQGVVIGAQRAVHLNLSLREHNYYRDDAIRPFDTPLGRVALQVDVDVNMPQVARAAVEAGATLLLSSQFIQLYDLYEDRVRYGAINAAVSNGVNVAAAAGMGGIIVRCDGRELAGFSEELPVVAALDPSRCHADRDAIAAGRRLLTRHRPLLADRPAVEGGRLDV